MAFVAVPARTRVGILVAVSAAVCLWRVWPAPPTAEPDPGWSLVPLSGSELRNANGAAGGCLPFLAPVIAHHGWELQIDERLSGGCRTEDLRRFVFNQHGGVTVHQRGLRDRELQLTASELGRLRTLDQGSCVRTDPKGYGHHFYELSIGPSDGTGGAHIAVDTEIGAAIGEIIDAAMLRYADHVAATHPIRIVLAGHADDPRGWTRRSAVYRLEVDAGGLLTVQRSGRELFRRQLESPELADLIDATYADVDYFALARGTIMIDRTSRDLTLGSLDPRSVLAIMSDAFHNAEQAWQAWLER